MDFVKVVGVVRSTIFVFKVLSTSIQIFGVNRIQTEAQQIENGPIALCAATSHRDAAPAPSASAPARRPTPLRPRSHAALGHASSQGRRRARDTSAFPRATRLPAVAPYVPRTRAGRGTSWYGGIFAVTATSRSSALFKHRRSFPRATPSRRPPLPPSRQARPPASILGRLTILTYSLGPLEACVFAHLLDIAPPCRSRSTPRLPPPAIAVRCRLVPFRPNSEHQRALGELTLLPAPLHGRERRRPRRNWPSRAAPMAKGHIASPHLFPRVFLQTEGMVVTF
jgi:hypothetical protein